jgi:vacuolar-type H+-ATPase subunit I/STV1
MTNIVSEHGSINSTTCTSLSSTSKDFHRKLRSLTSKIRMLEMENHKLQHQLTETAEERRTRSGILSRTDQVEKQDLKLELQKLKVAHEETLKLLEEKESFYIHENDLLRKTVSELKSHSSSLTTTKQADSMDTVRVCFIALHRMERSKNPSLYFM